MKDDTISRRAALDAADRADYTGLAIEDVKKVTDEVIKELKQLPSAQPTLYGYSVEHLAFVAAIMAKKGVSPEEAVAIFRDVNRVIEMMLEDMKEMQENALKQALKKPWEGGQE